MWGPEPYCGISKGYINIVINKWEYNEKCKNWNDTKGLKQSKAFIEISKSKGNYYRSLNRAELRIITGMLTGHCPLNYHLNKMGLVDDPVCRICLNEEETTEHIMCNCEGLEYRRYKHFGKPILEKDKVIKQKPKDLLGFMRDLKFLWE
ncbi:hypothetical protein [Klebsiella pneumoniae]|uniref:hypothetical protein n=1 Tax=Klebsiella pneumoniae TaxID=573 RepID=UPI00405542A5